MLQIDAPPGYATAYGTVVQSRGYTCNPPDYAYKLGLTLAGSKAINRGELHRSVSLSMRNLLPNWRCRHQSTHLQYVYSEREISAHRQNQSSTRIGLSQKNG